jgi:hypothetical protein
VWVTRSSLGRITDGDLPLYATVPDESKPTMGIWRRAQAAVKLPPRPVFAARAAVAETDKSPCFSRLVDLPGDELSIVLADWCVEEGVDGTTSIADGLVVSAVQFEGGTWSLIGHLRRGAGRRAVPVVVELWGYHVRFTRLTLTPRARVITSRRYFRVGHRALDGLERALLQRSRRLQEARP